MLRIMLQRHPSFKVEAELELVLVPHCRKSVIMFWHRRWHLTSGDSRDPRRRKTSLRIHVLFMSLIVTCIITVAQESIQLNKSHTHMHSHTSFSHILCIYFDILLSLYFAITLMYSHYSLYVNFVLALPSWKFKYHLWYGFSASPHIYYLLVADFLLPLPFLCSIYEKINNTKLNQWKVC